MICNFPLDFRRNIQVFPQLRSLISFTSILVGVKVSNFESSSESQPQLKRSPFEFKNTLISSPHLICLIEKDVKLTIFTGL